MLTRVCGILGIEKPIFAFSHCRDVVVEASKAGAMGVLGAAWLSTDQLERDLRWIDEHVHGKPYGVNLVFPKTYADVNDTQNPQELLPAEHREFVRRILSESNIPPLPPDDVEEYLRRYFANKNMTPEESVRRLEVALRHPIAFLVNAMGTPPKAIVERAHGLGLIVGSLVGTVEHAFRQREVGVDILIAQGTEAGGHTGTIASMVLWPQIVDAVSPLPVLAAGGVGRGRQMAAALALGADGVWCGTVWLGTKESEITVDLREQLFAAKSQDAVITRSMTGKPCRSLRSKFTEAWDRPDAPTPLPFPLQSFLFAEPARQIEHARAKAYMTYAVGQLVGDLKAETTVRHVIDDMLEEFTETVDRMGQFARG